MKKAIFCMVLIAMLAALTGCSGSGNSEATASATTEVSASAAESTSSAEEVTSSEQTAPAETVSATENTTEAPADTTTAAQTEATTAPDTSVSSPAEESTFSGTTSAPQTTIQTATEEPAKTTAKPVTRPPQTTTPPPETVEPPLFVEDLTPKAEKVTSTYDTLGADKAAKLDFIKQIDEKTDLPVINITTNGENITSLETYVSCVVDVFSCDEDMIISEASAGIKVRGNSSAYYGDVNQILRNQVPYRIKFDTKTQMLGLNNGAECRNWVLLRSDWDLIRNDIAFRFGRTIMGSNSYCSDSCFVHVYVNDKFKGIYVLCEQNQVNKHRVQVSEPVEGYKGTDIGYLLELDHDALREPDNYFFNMDYCAATVTDITGETRKFVPAEYSIKSDVYSQQQIDFIEKHLINLFKIVYEACENGKYYAFDKDYNLVASSFTNAEDTVNAVVDLQSVVDMYILYEIVHDYDCGEGSFFMCVDFAADSTCRKLQFTCPWDFNWAYDGRQNRYYAAAFNDISFVNDKGDRSNPWFIVLMKQDWFVSAVKEKWTALYNKDALRNCIKEETALLEKYDKDLNKVEDYATACSEDLIKWINKRLDWLDEQFVSN